jgi:hypothetical protein
MSKGWYYEGWRHSLAAKGISSRKSFGLFKKDPNAKPTEVFQDPKHKYGEGDRMRLTAIEEVRHGLEMKGNGLVLKGKLKYEDLERFMQQDFGVLKDQFMKGQIPYDQFTREAKQKFDSFTGVHSKTLGGLFSSPAKQGPGLFDFEGQVKGTATLREEPTQSMAWKDVVSGGMADKKRPDDFDPEQLVKGMKVEREHTANQKLALEIAMDHLTENPKYYDYLEKMEKEMDFESKGHSGKLTMRQWTKQKSPGHYELVKAYYDENNDIVKVKMEDLL